MLASLDTIKMYPNLDMKAAAKATADEFYNSKLKVKGVDYRAASIYIATRATRSEIDKGWARESNTKETTQQRGTSWGEHKRIDH